MNGSGKRISSLRDAPGADSSSSRWEARDAALVLLVVAGLGLVSVLARRLDMQRPAEDHFASYEEVYVTPEAARRMSLGFKGRRGLVLLRSLLRRKQAAYRATSGSTI